MDVTTIILIAIGLAMDCFAVSVASGIRTERTVIRNALKMALSFSGFQMLMPLLGWLTLRVMADSVAGGAQWIAFGTLELIGFKMIYDSFKEQNGEEKPEPFGLYVLLALSVATSIDAFAIGTSLAVLKTAVLGPILIIGMAAFCFSLAGLLLGNKAGRMLGSRAETVGGIILIGMGVKILTEHVN